MVPEPVLTTGDWPTIAAAFAAAVERAVAGCPAVLMNTGIAGARNPVLMAEAMRLAVDAGRKAFLAGRMPRRDYANASSPTTQLIE